LRSNAPSSWQKEIERAQNKDARDQTKDERRLTIDKAMLEIIQDKNAPYLLTAYAVFLGGLLIYFLSLEIRKRNVERDEETIRRVEEEEKRQE
jgi:hypothetical protein